MTKKLIFMIFSLVLVSSFCVYFYFFSNPEAFPSDQLMIEEINNIQTEVSVKSIQNRIFLNDKSVFVPFISDDGRYGSSYWIWSKRKWRIAHIESNDGPRLWKLNPNDPSTYQFAWHLHPDDQVKSLSFYLTKERYFVVNEGVSSYDPRVQMKITVPIKSNYGTLKLPDEWVSILIEHKKVFKSERLPIENFYYFNWIAQDKEGKEFDPTRSVAGESSSAGYEDEVIDFVMTIDETELE